MYVYIGYVSIYIYVYIFIIIFIYITNILLTPSSFLSILHRSCYSRAVNYFSKYASFLIFPTIKSSLNH